MKRELTERARQFRKKPTRGEARMWWALRRGRLGVRFYRQKVIGPFIADFACERPKLIVEIDGPLHASQRERDAERQRFLEDRGYLVVRFTDAEVRADLNQTLSRLQVFVTPLVLRSEALRAERNERGRG